MNVFKNIFKKEESNIIVECFENQIKINGLQVSFPIHLNTLKEVFGEPSKQEYDLLWRVVWDDLGVYTEYGTWDSIFDVKFLLSNNHELKHFPTNIFSGQIKVDNKKIINENFKEFDLKKHKIMMLTYKGKDEPYSISIGKNFDYKKKIPKNKYILKDIDEELIEFSDFGFKLSIIQVLMYDKELLQPKFDLYEYTEWYPNRKIDIEEEGYNPILEVTQYFKDLPIPKSFAKEITEIYQDGGNEIYLQLLRFGDGSENYWDIESVEDAKHFPNLKKAILCYAKENVLQDFKKLGINTSWL